MRVRVVTYNVRGFRDDRAALERTIRDLAPDVLLLNETGSRWRLRRTARALGMEVAADPWSPLRRRAKDAVLVRPPWWITEHRQQRFAASAFLYPRAALLAGLEREATRLWAVAIHLGLRPAERRRHVATLLETVSRLDGQVVIAGDTNELPEGKAMRDLGARFTDAWTSAGEGPGETIPARSPTARIDYVFVSRDVEVVRAWVPQTPDVARASDHRPVAVDLVLRDQRVAAP